MTFDHVLRVFSDYLKEDADLDVIQTRQGYTVLGWDGKHQVWERADYCGTPQALCENLSDSYATYVELNMTKGLRELTDQEQKQIDAESLRLKNLCERE